MEGVLLFAPPSLQGLPRGPPKIPVGSPRGADWCSHAGETLVFLKSERFACTRAPVGSPGGHWGTLGATFGVPRAALGRPSGCLGAFFVDLFASRTIHNTSVDKFGGGIAPNLIQDRSGIRSPKRDLFRIAFRLQELGRKFAGIPLTGTRQKICRQSAYRNLAENLSAFRLQERSRQLAYIPPTVTRQIFCCHSGCRNSAEDLPAFRLQELSRKFADIPFTVTQQKICRHSAYRNSAENVVAFRLQ